MKISTLTLRSNYISVKYLHYFDKEILIHKHCNSLFLLTFAPTKYALS